MFKYPMKFGVHSFAQSGIQTNWRSRALAFEEDVVVAIPKEFEGPGTGLSPEDLYALALQNCFIATFKVFAEKSKLKYDSIFADAELEVDRDEKGRPWMARINMRIRLTGALQSDNATRILEKTSQNCMILNSVNTQKIFHFELTP